MKCFQAVGFLGLAVALVCLTLFADSAHAGFTSVYAGASGDGYTLDYSWDVEDPDNLDVNEMWHSVAGGDYDLSVWGTTDSDPVLTITKDILNGTGTAWVGYNITLDPFDTDTFVGAPTSGGTSGGMTLAFMDAVNLNWGIPNTVLPGQTVSFTFQINVPDTGAFNFTLSQSPVLIPEPASIVLVGLAVVMLAACRRKFA